MQTIINCTPHPITIFGANNEVLLQLPKGETVPRLTQSSQTVQNIAGIPITETVFGETTDLPQQQAGVFLIVSRLVLAANPDRSDLLVPNDMVRDDSGNIIGCKSLARN